MTSFSTRARVALCCVAFAAACARTTDSTETGNPPVIDAELVALVAENGEVHVVGELGAVTPGGGELEVEALATGERARGPIATDGSFDVAIEATLEDTFRLRAIREQDEGASEPVFVDRDGPTEPPDAGAVTDAGTASCEERLDLIQSRVLDVETSSDRSCDSIDDCGELAAPEPCPYFCRGVAHAYSSETEVSASLDTLGAELCEPFQADGCFLGLPQPDCAVPPPIACIDQVCTRCDDGVCPETSCEPCATPLVMWSATRSTEGPGTGPSVYRLEDCRTLSLLPVSGETCTRELPCMRAPGALDGRVVAHVLNALGHPDVQAAITMGTSFGAITPGGFGFTLGVGDASIFVSETPCAGAASCREPPVAIDALRSLLENLAVDWSPCQ